ncbi:FIG00904907: hypothetical protein [hydrothermal vent metagenome]|uniref:WbqC-like protein family n=1 Tax=hydrothermal vent metagenome TaxID=652676 RepID=A0A3B1BSS5_9ZZZZ
MMRVAIMQPYLFPYIGYWQLFFNCDIWVFFDCVQYNKRSWMNRNRILHTNQNNKFQYVNVPIKKHGNGAIIKDVRINIEENYKEKIMGQLTVYKHLRAPYYEDVIDLIKDILSERHIFFISLITCIADKLCNYLEIQVEYKISTELDFDESIIHEPDDWALSITKALKADEYINPYGGAELFNENKYLSNDVHIKFLKPTLNEYKQSQREFVSELSIIDILMFNSKATVRSMLKNDFQLLPKSELLNG